MHTSHESTAPAEAVWAVICDNYLVGANGPSECLHRTEKRVFEI